MRQRVYEIEIDDKVIVKEDDSGVQLRAQFTVTIDALGHVTLCDLNLSNLAEGTIMSAFKKGSVIAIRAGYTDKIDYIFKGIIRNVFRGRDGATTNTQILARGGDLAKSEINVALGKNTKLSDILQKIASAMGYRLTYKKEDFTGNYVTGYSMTGNPEMTLDKLARAWDFKWTIEQNSLVVFKVETGRTNTTRTINMQAGLVGIPEVTEVGVDFSVRMDPSLKIGSLIELDTTYKSFNFSGVYYPTQIQNGAGDGTYTLLKIVHSGDNYGSEWTTKCTGYNASYSEIY